MTHSNTTTSPRLVYAGIGARSTPSEILAYMTRIAQWLQRTGWHLNTRRGGRRGPGLCRRGDGSIPHARIALAWVQRSRGTRLPHALRRGTSARPQTRRALAPGLAEMFAGRPGVACAQCRRRHGTGAEPSRRHSNLLDPRRKTRRRHRDGAAHRGPGRNPRAEPGRGFAARRVPLPPRPPARPRCTGTASAGRVGLQERENDRRHQHPRRPFGSRRTERRPNRPRHPLGQSVRHRPRRLARRGHRQIPCPAVARDPRPARVA